MSVTINSTTDTEAQILSATGGAKAKEVPSDTPAAATEKSEQAEISDASGASTEEPSEKEDLPKDGESEDEEEDESEGEGDPKKDPPKKKLKGFKKRIDKLSRRLTDSEKQADYWRNEALKAKQVPEAKIQSKVETKSDDRPKADAYDSHDAYIEALTDWKLDQRDKARESKASESQKQNEIKSAVTKYQEGVKAVKSAYSDYDSVIEECDVIMPAHVSSLLLDSENGPELAYHLAKNEEELERIVKLSPTAAAREIGRFEAKYLKAQESKDTKESKITKAPAPIKPVGSSTSAVSQKDPEKMDFQEYKKWRAAQSRA